MAVSQSNYKGLKRGLQEWSSCAGELLGEREKAYRWTGSVSRWLIDASLLGDIQNLHEGLEALRTIYHRLPLQLVEQPALVMTLMEVARAALDRAREAELQETLVQNSESLASRLVVVLYGAESALGLWESEVSTQVETDAATVRRSLNALAERGLVLNTRHKREDHFEFRWHITPRGEATARRMLHRKADR